MYNIFLKGSSLSSSIMMVIAIMMQSSKQKIEHGKCILQVAQINYSESKKHVDLEAVMQRSTAVMGAVWMILLFVLAFFIF